ncbi:class I SAM-dependent methyltransferase [Actinomadura sp. ATCC 31491]|uniref:Class I SAM-dependent methyltransferase n=1 Tax=Actinomadura luzonensis TaxID=2805427 RepID=A0ABT0GCG6_9ACTN|nr:class I SAM-dependent methyltransferase [Actinomadura luzonensis]MCK2221940.1 class I SAM-dependent methyltransferase [Actinomadura luzonensis]
MHHGVTENGLAEDTAVTVEQLSLSSIPILPRSRTAIPNLGFTRSHHRMDVVNHDQFQAWNGAEGAAWAKPPKQGENRGSTETCQRLIAIAGIGPEDRVLDIGCGTGTTTLLAARQATDGSAVGVDLSAPMLRQARLAATAAGIGNAVFEQADAQIHPFPDGAFDVAISMYGVMFFADPVAAFANIGRALRPGGRLAAVCPQPPEECAWYVIPVAALLGVPPAPREVVARYPGDRPAMFSLSDPARLRDVLVRAGFADASVEPARVPLNFGRTADEAAEALLASGPARYLVEQDELLSWGEAQARLEAALKPYESSAGVLLPGAQWLVTAHAPGSLGKRRQPS